MASAIRLFAARGYDGASLRDIAADAGAKVGLIDHHFGNTDALYAAAVASKAGDIAEALIRSLEQRVAQTDADSPDVETIVEAYVAPFWEHAVAGDAWRDHARMTFDLVAQPDRMKLAQDYLAVTDRATDRYRQALANAMPGVSEEDIQSAVRLINLSTNGLIVHTCSIGFGPGLEAMRRQSLLRFFIGGVIAIGTASAQPD